LGVAAAALFSCSTKGEFSLRRIFKKNKKLMVKWLKKAEPYEIY
jgi:hypothetical protein